MIRAIFILTTLAPGIAALAADHFDFRDDDRPEHAKSVSADSLSAERAASDVTVLDVRLIEDFEADPELIPGALYRNPDDIERWADSLSGDSKVVVYCVRGKWVSHKAADYLSRKGLDAYVLEGGLEAWRQAAE